VVWEVNRQKQGLADVQALIFAVVAALLYDTPRISGNSDASAGDTG